MEEKRRVLEMLQAGAIGLEEAEALLKALEERPKGEARLLRVRVQATDKGKPVRIQLNLPLTLAQMVETFLPQEAKAKLREKGVDLSALLQEVRTGIPEGKLLEVAAEEDGEPVEILVEVV
ncbi:hypothetical protein YIM1640_03580 [Thermus oshimai]|uniref:SHOCT-like domain-containing protein n=1 Tax=Thermus oshimai TaxID=56957 RepID=UPI0031FBA30A